MIEVGRIADGATLAVKARPGAKKNALLGEHGGALKVSVTAAPEKGKANQAIAKLLAEKFDLKVADVQLLRGETSSDKVFCFRGVEPERITEQLQKLGLKN